MDHVEPKKRSAIMKAIGRQNTKPEMIVRSAAHHLGLRFRLHKKGLPGTPDLVFPKWKTVIFVHGCYWHRHPHCKRATVPKTNQDFWLKKLNRNVEHDKKVQKELQKRGWRVLVFWQCEVKSIEEATKLLRNAFRSC